MRGEIRKDTQESRSETVQRPLVKCPRCDCMLRPSRIRAHLRKHSLTGASAIPKTARRQIIPPKKDSPANLHKSRQASKRPRRRGRERSLTCPVCRVVWQWNGGRLMLWTGRNYWPHPTPTGLCTCAACCGQPRFSHGHYGKSKGSGVRSS